MKNYYEISYSDREFDHKPSGREIGLIKNSLQSKEMTIDYMARLIGENGHSFSPAVFSDGTKKENFMYQQLVGLDFDHGARFAEIKAKADKYRLPMLFAYKTFSWQEDDERFRVIFALSAPITDIFSMEVIIAIFMRIFEVADPSCKDCSRLFFGGKGCLYVADEPHEICFSDLQMALNLYMRDTYDENHYRQKIKEFYTFNGVEFDDKSPVIKNGVLKQVVVDKCKSESSAQVHQAPQHRRQVTRGFDYAKLYERCRMFRDFKDGSEYYYYNELLHIATNLINIEKGKRVFLSILNSPVNERCEAYFSRDWKTILNELIDRDYSPMSCSECKYANECLHQKNMILTAKPTDSCICTVKKKEYCSLEEAELSLRENFLKAVNSNDEGFHVIIAQTGIGKTNMFLHHLMSTDRKYIIAVPTHKLAGELLSKAQAIGIDDILSTPELPSFTDKAIQAEIGHIYSVGAGELVIRSMEKILCNIRKGHPDYLKLSEYIKSVRDSFSYSGNIITTHERLLYLNRKSNVLKDHEVIIDEDILRNMFPTCVVRNEDMQKALDCDYISSEAKDKIRTILSAPGFYKYSKAEKVTVNDEILDNLHDIDSDVIDLIRSCEIYNNGEYTTYIKKKRIPFNKAIVMSATADAEIYKLFLRKPVYEYHCKQAAYKGRLKVYPKYTFSRYNLGTNDAVMQYIRDNRNDGEVITFMKFEDRFDSHYHFGAVEGLNCLEGKDINVVGLPNLDDSIYKLYAMLAGDDISGAEMRPMWVEYNDYKFKIQTFSDYMIRKIQLWNLSSLLEQAVGRARLLRYDCEVRVFARFPIDQAEYM